MMKVIVIFSLCVLVIDALKCVPRYFDEDSFVCVCNSTYCDNVGVQVPNRGQYRTYVSTSNGARLDTQVRNFTDKWKNNESITLYLNIQKTYQIVYGFGGAFTDSAGVNIANLSSKAQDMLMKSLYGRRGSQYNLGRVPIGGTDFSTRPYTLDDTPGNVNLSKFSLAPEDYKYKIPYMRRALELNPEIKFFSAAWSAPPWMKTNDEYYGFLGFLKSSYYQVYAEYLTKFLESYKNEGLPIWAISTGNEPSEVYLPGVRINNMGWTPYTVSQFVVNNLAPTIANSSSSETSIWALDDQRFFLPWVIELMYENNRNVMQYIDAIAVHWYGDKFTPPTLLDDTHRLFPNQFLIMTEACTGSEYNEKKKVRLGSWNRGERYIQSIIQYLNHWSTGWVEWNIALNENGGPTWIKNNVDSSIIVNAEADEFYKQPMYYAITHVSKFVPRGSVKVDLTTNDNIDTVAFLTPENTITVVLFNKLNKEQPVTIVDREQGHINVRLAARSFNTIIYRT